MAASTFREQMQYLKANGYRVISLRELVEFTRLERQLPQRSVVLTFDDGYKSFRQHAYPVLKELGFPATLFVYTDYVGAGRNALSWQDLRELGAEGVDVQAHSKTHQDLRRITGEPDGQPMSYSLDHKEGGRRLLESHTLVESGVQDGDHLIVYPEVVAGRS